MPKYLVYVERLVPQYRTVVVDAACPEDVEANALQVFEAACQLDCWEYDDDGDRASKPSAVNVVEAADDEADLRL